MTNVAAWVSTALVLAAVVAAAAVLAFVGRRSAGTATEAPPADPVAPRVAGTEQPRQEDSPASERWFRSLLQNSSDMVTVLDGSGFVVYQTPSAKRVLGYERDALVGTRFEALLTPADTERLAVALEKAGQTQADGTVLELDVLHAAGHHVHTEATVASLLDDPEFNGFVLTLRDVSERRRLQDRLLSQAYTDTLTGLANRAYFTERVAEALVAAPRAQVAVLFVDLDGFKAVNDTRGHEAGDRLLVLVGERLRACVRPSDVVARLGGDEFGILLSGSGLEEATAWIANRISARLADVFDVDGHTFTLGASTGVALNERGDEDADVMLRNADLAMYRAKAAGKASFVRFRERMRDEAVARVETQAELRHAVGLNQLVLHYQPLVELSSGRIVGAEALVRWQHPTRGLLAPDVFIPIAEETGVIREIGVWVLEEACRRAVGWQAYAREGEPFHLSVNLSVRQLVLGWPAKVSEILGAAGLPPAALCLEVTESVLMDRTAEAIGLLRALRRAGVSLALDDFGTGFSSLSYLTRMPVDVLKIDRTFVEQVGLDVQQSEVVRAIVRLADALRLQSVAEGIETKEQWSGLVAMGCQIGQGFLFSRPLPAEELDVLLAAGVAALATPGPVASTG